MCETCFQPVLESTFFSRIDWFVLLQSNPRSGFAVLPLGGFQRIAPAIWPEPCSVL
ncbi:hypothetical protein SAMN05216596_102711 [Pseudomonas congelans]|uniref:Uncharacterized protein n=1 Tax=Pseudomonas congelans TaxID=200452 RepID=A0A1H0PL37_9PSED|nr:hypothetical protein SAMN05216596_102711 [Pseudomonas congelans]